MFCRRQTSTPSTTSETVSSRLCVMVSSTPQVLVPLFGCMITVSAPSASSSQLWNCKHWTIRDSGFSSLSPCINSFQLRTSVVRIPVRTVGRVLIWFLDTCVDVSLDSQEFSVKSVSNEIIPGFVPFLTFWVIRVLVNGASRITRAWREASKNLR